MSGELTPAEAAALLRELDTLGARVLDLLERAGGKLGGHIDWLTEQVADRDDHIERLLKALDEAREAIEHYEND